MKWQNRMVSGSPPCSPQIPIFIPLRVFRAHSMVIIMSRPTPLMSRTSKGLCWRIPRSLYRGRNLFSASSLEKENVAWVRSFVPKDMNSASSAMRPALMQALTTSIMVPNLNGTLSL